MLLSRLPSLRRRVHVIILAALGLLPSCYRDIPPDPRAAVELLGDLVQDGDPIVRRTAVEALGKIGDPVAEPLLIGALADPATGVRAAAARALARQPSIGDAGVRGLLHALRDPEPGVRTAAAAALGGVESGDRHGAQVAPLLEDANPAIRKVAAHALYHLQDTDEAALAPLTRLTRDQDASLRQWAVAALGELGGARAIAALSDRLLHDEADAVRAEAAYRLRFVGEAPTVEAALRQLVKSERDAGVRRWAEATLAGLTRSGSD